MQTLKIIRPDDWHLHVRDHEFLASVVPHTARCFGRAIIMPNLKPPVTTVAQAHSYRDRILAAMQLSRDEVYIANILKCRPPNNRDPLPDEMEKCFPHLDEQIRLIKPKLICALGRISAQGLLKTSTPLGKLRKRWHDYKGTPMLVTYHPAALLRFPVYKKDTWEDMQLLKARLDGMK